MFALGWIRHGSIPAYAKRGTEHQLIEERAKRLVLIFDYRLQIALSTTALSKAAITVDVPRHPNQAILAAMFQMQYRLFSFIAPHPICYSIRVGGKERSPTNRASQLSRRRFRNFAKSMLKVGNPFGHASFPRW
jgi:hypothetical protein